MALIMIDMDDTIENLCDAWVERLNTTHGLNISSNDVNDWDMTKTFPTLTEAQIYEPLFDDTFWDTVKPKKFAQDAIKKLIEAGHNVNICTATDYRCMKAKYERVIKKYFPYIKWENVIVAYDKSLIKADFFIDDKPENLERDDGCICLLMNAPHNKKYKTNGKMIRVDGWEEAYSLIKFYNYLANNY